MHEPRNEEERKALRLENAYYATPSDTGFVGGKTREGYLRVMSESRAIVREEQDAGSVATPYDAREAELAQVRADITRTSERMSVMSQALLYKYGTRQSTRPAFPPYEEELDRLVHAYCTQSARERELMAKSEPEGGDRG